MMIVDHDIKRLTKPDFWKKKKKKKISGPNLGVKGLNQAQVMFFAIFLGLDH